MELLEFAKDYIFTWEDGSSKDVKHTHSVDSIDSGNWDTGVQGHGKLIGSNHGVTAQALATYRKVPVATITFDVMHQLTLDEAAQLALKQYYYGPNLDKLPWDAVVASVMDFGWTAGQTAAARHLQRMVGVTEDAHIGPGTAKAYVNYVAKHGLEQTAKDWAQARIDFYTSLNKPKYIKGYTNRSNYFLPGTTWWKKFN